MTVTHLDSEAWQVACWEVGEPLRWHDRPVNGSVVRRPARHRVLQDDASATSCLQRWQQCEATLFVCYRQGKSIRAL